MTLPQGQPVTYYRATRFEVSPTAATVVRDEGEWVVLRVAAFKNPIRVKRTSIRENAAPCAT